MKRRGDRQSAGLILLLTIGMVVGMVPHTGTATAQNVVLIDSDVSKDTTWSKGSGPYRLVDSISVADGATLRIEPGVTIEFASNVSMTVEGTLAAEGAPNSPIMFTSSRSDPGPGAWGTIRLEGPFTRVHSFRHVTIEYATNGITIPGRQGANLQHVEIKHSSNAGIMGSHGGKFARSGRVTLKDSILRQNHFGIRGYDERYTITGTRIVDNRKSGVYVANPLNVAEIEIKDSRIEANDIGINLESRAQSLGVGGEVTTIRLENTSVRENAGVGVRIFGDRLHDIRLLDSTVRSNGGSGIHLQDVGLGSGSEASGNIAIRNIRVLKNGNRGLIIDGAYSDLQDVSVMNVVVDGSGADGVWIEADRTLSRVDLTATEVRRNNQRGVQIGGRVIEDVTVSDLEVLANRGDGLIITGEETTGVTVESTLLSSNGQTGLQLNGTAPDSGSSVNDVLIVGNQDGLALHEHASVVTRSDIVYNNGTGLHISGSSTASTNVTETNIFENGKGMAFADTGDAPNLDLRNIYWGSSSGPTHDSINPEGEGNAVSSELESHAFIPFANSPFGQVYQQPNPSFDNKSLNVSPGSEVVIRAAVASGSGSATWYRFTFNDSTDSGWTNDSTLTRTFEKPGTYRVNLSVIDENGVPSGDSASMTITVAEQTNSDETSDNKSDGNSNSESQSGSDENVDEEESDVRVPGFGFLGPLLVLFLLGGFLVYKRHS